jgi:hypothetical protein
MALPRVRLLIPIIWSIIILLPIVHTQPPPKATCDRQIPSYSHAEFKKDCRDLSNFVTTTPGPLSNSSAWEKAPKDESDVPMWWISRGICSFTFTIYRPLSSDTWDTVIDELKAIQQDCVDQSGVGGSRLRNLGIDRLGLDSLAVSITQLPQAPTQPQEGQKVQNPGGKRYAGIGERTLRRRTLCRGHVLEYSSMATRRKIVGNTARGFYALFYPHPDRHFRPSRAVKRQARIIPPITKTKQFAYPSRDTEAVKRSLVRRDICHNALFTKGAHLTAHEKKVRKGCMKMLLAVTGTTAASLTAVMRDQKRLAGLLAFSSLLLGGQGAAEVASGKLGEYISGGFHPIGRR